MITEELKATVADLSVSEQKELEFYLLKLRLENDPEYWERIRKKTASYSPSNPSGYVDAESVA